MTSSATAISPKHHLSQHGILCKSLAILVVLLIFFNLLFLLDNPSSTLLIVNRSTPPAPLGTTTDLPTNLTHIMFVLVGSLRTWRHRKAYIESWWRPNVTRGHIFLDKPPTPEFLPWPPTAPPFQLNEDIKKLRYYPKLRNPVEIRIYRSILDSFRLGENEGVRWYIMADDDTVFMLDNLVGMLGKYDHRKDYYIGMNSETIRSNYDFSFDMAFGGAGYALSFSMVERLVGKMDECVDRYPNFHASDHLSSYCSADLGVDLTFEKGIHQIDLTGDISGLLSAHPQTPLITLHHFDIVNPIFPFKNRIESVNHLMKAANVDQSRLLQQTICYHRQFNWTFSVSWGYSVHVYESIQPRSILKRPLETFRPWKIGRPPLYMFNTRALSNDPCKAPHQFFFEKIDGEIRESNHGALVTTSYARKFPRNLPACLSSGNHSFDGISQIQVWLTSQTNKEAGRIECCDVGYVGEKNVTDLRFRACRKDEVIA